MSTPAVPTWWQRLNAPDDRTMFEKWQGVPDRRGPLRRLSDDHGGKMFGGLLAGMIVVDGLLTYQSEKSWAKSDAEWFGYKVGNKPGARTRTLTPAQVRRVGATAKFEAAFGVEAPAKITARRLNAAADIAARPKKQLVRIASAAGLPDARTMKKLDLARSLAPLAGSRKLDRAVAAVEAGGKGLARGSLAASATRNTAASQVASGAAKGAVAATKGVAKLSLQGAKFFAKEVLHKAPMSLRFAVATPVGRLGLLGAAGYGAYKLAQWRFGGTAASPPTSRQQGYFDDGARTRTLALAPPTASAVAPSPRESYTTVDGRTVEASTAQARAWNARKTP